MKNRFLAVLFLSNVIGASPALADEGLPLSYLEQGAHERVAENVVAMQAWAEGEYKEHELEGLFKKYPQDGKLLLEMAAVSKELQAKAEAAKQAGEVDKARAYYYSAEAVAQYAAQMPHMLEHRMQGKK